MEDIDLNEQTDDDIHLNSLSRCDINIPSNNNTNTTCSAEEELVNNEEKCKNGNYT